MSSTYNHNLGIGGPIAELYNHRMKAEIDRSNKGQSEKILQEMDAAFEQLTLEQRNQQAAAQQQQHAKNGTYKQ